MKLDDFQINPLSKHPDQIWGSPHSFRLLHLLPISAKPPAGEGVGRSLEEAHTAEWAQSPHARGTRVPVQRHLSTLITAASGTLEIKPRGDCGSLHEKNVSSANLVRKNKNFFHIFIYYHLETCPQEKQPRCRVFLCILCYKVNFKTTIPTRTLTTNCTKY